MVAVSIGSAIRSGPEYKQKGKFQYGLQIICKKETIFRRHVGITASPFVETYRILVALATISWKLVVI